MATPTDPIRCRQADIHFQKIQENNP